MSSQWDKMVAGKLYNASDPQFREELLRCRRLLHEFNHSSPDDAQRREELLAELIGQSAGPPHIEPPFYCDYGRNITLGKNLYMNFNCVILDVTPVNIGDNVLLGPGVQIYAATHPLDWRIRAEGLENGAPVTIGSDVWIGGSAVLCPGVDIGPRTVIGAGSVVTRDIPAGVLAVGNPCRVIRELE